MAVLWAIQEIGITNLVEMLVEIARHMALSGLARLRGIVIEEGLNYPDRNVDGGGRDRDKIVRGLSASPRAEAPAA